MPVTYRKRNRWRSTLLLSAETITFSGAITAFRVHGWSVIPLRSSINIARIIPALFHIRIGTMRSESGFPLKKEHNSKSTNQNYKKSKAGEPSGNMGECLRSFPFPRELRTDLRGIVFLGREVRYFLTASLFLSGVAQITFSNPAYFTTISGIHACINSTFFCLLHINYDRILQERKMEEM